LTTSLPKTPDDPPPPHTHTPTHPQAPDDDLALQRLMSLTGNKSADIFNGVMQQQLDAAAAAQQDNINAQRDAAARRVSGRLECEQRRVASHRAVTLSNALVSTRFGLLLWSGLLMQNG